MKITIDRKRSNMGFFGYQGQVTEENSLISPEFKFNQDCMAVLTNCKFDEDPMKTEGPIDRTRSRMAFFSTQGQVTPK